MRPTRLGRCVRRVLFVATLTLTLPAVCAAGPESHRAAAPPGRDRQRIEGKLSRLPDRGEPSLPPASAARTVTAKQGPPAQTLSVQCDLGQSLSDAVRRSTGSSVLIHVSGTCRESVRVLGDNVTLSGVQAGGAIIDPPDTGGEPALPAVEALGVQGLTLEKLTLTGGTEGLRAIGSRDVTLREVTASGNANGTVFGEGFGAYFENSQGVVENSDLSANEAPVVAFGHSLVTVSDTRIHDNTLDGPFSFRFSSLALVRCDIADNALGAQAVDYSRTVVFDSTVAGNTAGFAVNNSDLRYLESTVTGSLEESADRRSILSILSSSVESEIVFLNRSSSLELFGSTFTATGSAPDRGIQAFHDSFVLVRSRLGVPSDIDGNVLLGWFTNGVFDTDSPITGGASCFDRSGATFDQAPVGGESGCS